MVFRRHCKAENRIAQLSSTTSLNIKNPQPANRGTHYIKFYTFSYMNLKKQ